MKYRIHNFDKLISQSNHFIIFEAKEKKWKKIYIRLISENLKNMKKQIKTKLCETKKFLIKMIFEIVTKQIWTIKEIV